MGISLSRFNSSPTSSRKPSMIPSQFWDSLLSSISVGVVAHTHHSVLSHNDHPLPLLASYLPVHGNFVSPIWLWTHWRMGRCHFSWALWCGPEDYLYICSIFSSQLQVPVFILVSLQHTKPRLCQVAVQYTMPCLFLFFYPVCFWPGGSALPKVSRMRRQERISEFIWSNPSLEEKISERPRVLLKVHTAYGGPAGNIGSFPVQLPLSFHAFIFGQM